MTIEQRSELERALTRADANGIRIVGRGVVKGSGTRYFVTTGKTSQKNHDHVLHTVRVEGPRLVCDCTASQYGRYCQHRAVCHRELAYELAAQKAAEALEAKMEAARIERQAADTYRQMLNDDYPPFAA